MRSIRILTIFQPSPNHKPNHTINDKRSREKRSSRRRNKVEDNERITNIETSNERMKEINQMKER